MDLRRSWDEVLAQADEAGAAMDKSVFALRYDQANLTKDVKSIWKAISQYTSRIHWEMLRILALHGPVARDLRRVFCAMQISRELDRLGKLARHIAKQVRKRAREADPVPILPILAQLAAETETFVGDALASLRLDASLGSRPVNVANRRISRLGRAARKELRKALCDDTERADSWLRLIKIARKLERAAARSHRVAELVVYLMEGNLEGE
jgi:phosphate transport system protein